MDRDLSEVSKPIITSKGKWWNHRMFMQIQFRDHRGSDLLGDVSHARTPSEQNIRSGKPAGARPDRVHRLRGEIPVAYIVVRLPLTRRSWKRVSRTHGVQPRRA